MSNDHSVYLTRSGGRHRVVRPNRKADALKNVAYLERAQEVPFSTLYLDPNNPRLARADSPGYADPKKLIDPTLQQGLENEIDQEFDAKSLADAIIGQG